MFFRDAVGGLSYTDPHKPPRKVIGDDLERLRYALRSMTPFTRRYLDACLSLDLLDAGMCEDIKQFEISEHIFTTLERICEGGYVADLTSSKRSQAKALIQRLTIAYSVAVSTAGRPKPSSAIGNPFYDLVMIGLDCVGIQYQDPRKLILEVLAEDRIKKLFEVEIQPQAAPHKKPQ